jgi:TonB family protein
MEQKDSTGPDIFLSYASADRERVAPLAKALEDLGWIIWWDRKIPVGKSFDEVIEEGLTKSKCVVVVWSEGSVTSDWVKTEAGEAKKRQKLTPVMIDSVEPPLEFRRIQAADLTDWQPGVESEEFDHLVTAIKGLAGEPRLVESPPQEVEPTDGEGPEKPRVADPEPDEATPEPEVRDEESVDVTDEDEEESETDEEVDNQESGLPPPVDRRALVVGIIAAVAVLILVGVWLWPEPPETAEPGAIQREDSQVITPADDPEDKPKDTLGEITEGGEEGPDTIALAGEPVTEVEQDGPSGSTGVDSEVKLPPDDFERGRQLLRQAAKAMGGLDNLKNIVSVLTKGTETFFDGEEEEYTGSVSVLSMPPDRFRIEYAGGKSAPYLIVRNGSEAWSVSGHLREIEKLGAAEIAYNDSLAKRDILNILRSFDAPYYQVVLVDSGTMGDDYVYWVGVLDSVGDTICQLGIDTLQHLPIASMYWERYGEAEGMMVENLSDFQLTEGVLVPMKSVVTLNSQRVIETVWSAYRLNVDILPGAFDEPTGDSSDDDFVVDSGEARDSRQPEESAPTGVIGTPENFKRGTVLLADAAKAMGGLLNLKRMVSVMKKGTRIVTWGDRPGLDISESVLSVPPDRYRREIEVLGGTSMEVRNGREGWVTGGTGKIKELSAGAIASMDTELERDIHNILGHLDAPYYRSLLVDSGTLEDEYVYWVALLGPGGDTICQLGIDAVQHLPIASMYWKGTVNGEGTVVETLSDFEMIDGVLVPMKSVVALNGQKTEETIWSEYRLNVQITPDAFDKPTSAPPLDADTPTAAGDGAIEIDIADEDYLPDPDEFVPVEVYPEFIYQPPLEYPRLPQQAGITGVVWVQALVDKDGNVRDARVNKSSGTDLLDEAALKQAKDCKFKPGIQSGRPVACWVTYKVEFTLDK